MKRRDTNNTFFSRTELQEIEIELKERGKQLWENIREEIEEKGIEQHQQLMQTIRDEGDTALAELQESIVYIHVQRKAKEIGLINDSLQKIKDGQYGICEDCNQPISRGRLRVLPYAKRCLDCQEQWDRIYGV